MVRLPRSVFESTIVHNDGALNEFDSFRIEDELSRTAAGIESNALAELGLDREGLSEKEPLELVIAEIEKTIGELQDLMAQSEQFDRDQEQLNREIQIAQAEVARLAPHIDAPIPSIERRARMYLPDSYEFDGDKVLAQLRAGKSLAEISKEAWLPYPRGTNSAASRG